MRRIIQLEAFRKEIAEFPLETREDIFSLMHRFLSNERLNSCDFRTFNIDGRTRIQEFKVKDSKGNWRAISCLHHKEYLVLVYAFHKKSQELQEKDKEVIRNRVKGIWL